VSGQGLRFGASDVPGTTPTRRWVRVVRMFDAPPSRVYRAWSSPEELAAWFSSFVEGSLAVGARTILTWHDRRIPIDVLEANPGGLFHFRWPWLPNDTYQTDVTVQLAPYGYGTRLVLTDGPFDIDRPGVIEAYAESLEGWGEALTWLRARTDFGVDLRRQVM